MGLFDGAIGNVLNNLGGAAGGQEGGGMMQIVMSLVRQYGGLGGLLDTLTNNGLGEQVASWIGNGQNLPVSADQLIQALGSGPLASVASQFGLNTQDLGGKLAQFLPEAVNQLSPAGQLPDNANDTEQLANQLAGLAGKLFG